MSYFQGGNTVDHIVYVDAKEKELESILDGSKTMVIRAAQGRKIPYGKVRVGDRLFFARNNGEGLIQAQAVVSSVYNSDKLSESESKTLIEDKQSELKLSTKQFSRWAGKRYVTLIGIADAAPVTPFAFDRSSYGNMDDWLPVDSIEAVSLAQ